MEGAVETPKSEDVADTQAPVDEIGVFDDKSMFNLFNFILIL